MTTSHIIPDPAAMPAHDDSRPTGLARTTPHLNLAGRKAVALSTNDQGKLALHVTTDGGTTWTELDLTAWLTSKVSAMILRAGQGRRPSEG
jgi:hypothetical protein